MACLILARGSDGLSALLAWINPPRTIRDIATSQVKSPANITHICDGWLVLLSGKPSSAIPKRSEGYILPRLSFGRAGAAPQGAGYSLALLLMLPPLPLSPIPSPPLTSAPPPVPETLLPSCALP